MRQALSINIRGYALLAGLWLLLFAAPASAQVEMTDLGSLGGGWSQANDISNAGHVVGWSDTTSGEPDAFIWHEGVMSLLGSIKAGPSSALSVNSSGDAVGYHQYTTGKKAVVWQDGVANVIGAKLLGTTSLATHINEAGLVAGTFSDSKGLSRAFLWQNGMFTNLGSAAKVMGLSDNGTVLLSTSGGLKIKSKIKIGTTIIDPDGTRGLLTYNSTVPVAGAALNNRGQVVGSYMLPYYIGRTGFWVDTTLTTQVTSVTGLGGYYNALVALNDLGTSVGYSIQLDDNSMGSFLYDPTTGATTDIGNLGGAIAQATSINNANQVGGYSENLTGDSHAFLWENGQITDLDPTGSDSAVDKINDQGNILGYRMMEDGNMRAVIWTKLATPEDTIESIEANIDNLLDENILNEGQTTAFQSTLDNLMASITKENANSTCGQLGSLTKKIESAIKSGKLEIEQGNALLESAAQLDAQVCVA